MLNKITMLVLLIAMSFGAVAYDKPDKPVQDNFDNHSKYIHAMLIYEAMITREHNKQTHFRADTKYGTYRFYPYQSCEFFDNPGDYKHRGAFTDSKTGKVFEGCYKDGYYIKFRHAGGIARVPPDTIRVVNPAKD